MDLEDVPWGVSSEGVSMYGVGTYLHHMSNQPVEDGLSQILGVAHYPQVLSLLAHGYTPPEPGERERALALMLMGDQAPAGALAEAVSYNLASGTLLLVLGVAVPLACASSCTRCSPRRRAVASRFRCTRARGGTTTTRRSGSWRWSC